MDWIKRGIYGIVLVTSTFYGCLEGTSTEKTIFPKRPSIDTVSGKIIASRYEEMGFGALENLEAVLKADSTTYFLKDEKTPEDTRNLIKEGNNVTLTIDPKNKRIGKIGKHYYFSLENLLVVNGDTLNIRKE